jgi:transcriptional regulator with XRE-family HTH domain
MRTKHPDARLARLVRSARAVSGMSQAELATRIGTSKQFIGLVESGRNRASVDTLQRMAEELDLDDTALVGAMLTDQIGDEYVVLVERAS